MKHWPEQPCVHVATARGLLCFYASTDIVVRCNAAPQALWPEGLKLLLPLAFDPAVLCREKLHCMLCRLPGVKRAHVALLRVQVILRCEKMSARNVTANLPVLTGSALVHIKLKTSSDEKTASCIDVNWPSTSILTASRRPPSFQSSCGGMQVILQKKSGRGLYGINCLNQGKRRLLVACDRHIRQPLFDFVTEPAPANHRT